MSGSDQEPVAALPVFTEQQMRAATETLREPAWMIAPLTEAPLLDETDIATEADSARP